MLMHSFLRKAHTQFFSRQATCSSTDYSPLLEVAIAGLDHVFETNIISSSSEINNPPANVDNRNLSKQVDRILASPSLEKLPVIPLSTRLVVLVLRKLDLNPERAVSFFVWSAKQPKFRHSIRTCNQLLDSLVKARKIQEAHWIFRNKFYHLFQPDGFTYTVLVRGYCQAGDVSQACKLFDEMLRRGLQAGVNAYNILLSGLTGAARIDDALKYYSLMQKFGNPDVVTYNTMLDGLVKSGRYDRAIEFFKKDILGQGCLPDLHTFAVLSQLLCKTGKSGDARKLLDEMADRGVHPDAVLYTSVIKGLADTGNVEAAFEVFEDMMTRKHCSPDVCTYTVLLDGLCKASRMKDAYRFVENMPSSCRPDVPMLNVLMDGDVKARRLENARDILKTYVPEPSVVTYTLFIHGLCKAGRVDEAMGIYSKMLDDEKCPPNVLTYTTLIDGLGKTGRGLEAAALFEEMVGREVSPGTSTCNALLTGLCRSGLMDQAMEFFGKMVPEKNIRTYNIVMDGLCKAGRMSQAHELLVAMDFVPNAHTYNAFINGLCKANRIDEALAFLREIVDGGFMPNVVIYNTILFSLWKSGRTSDVHKILQEMTDKGVKADMVTHNILKP